MTKNEIAGLIHSLFVTWRDKTNGRFILNDVVATFAKHLGLTGVDREIFIAQCMGVPPPPPRRAE